MGMKHVLSGGTALLLIAALATGCGNDSPTQATDDTPLLRTVPLAGTTEFEVSESIHMTFNEPVDTVQFHSMFFCLDSTSHEALQDSLMGGMMGMGHDHQDTAAFYDRMHDRTIEGHISWNNTADSCVFEPDGEFMHDMEYVLRIRHDFPNHHGERMRHMGEPVDNDPIVRFRTHKP